MAKKFLPKIITANDLLDGDNIYFTSQQTWSLNHSDALIAISTEQAEHYLALASAQTDRIVGAYLADIEVSDEGLPQPVHYREALRTRGPSNYFHGKQAKI